MRNGLAEKGEGNFPRYKTTVKGEEALRHMRELEALMPEREDSTEEEGALLSLMNGSHR